MPHIPMPTREHPHQCSYTPLAHIHSLPLEYAAGGTPTSKHTNGELVKGDSCGVVAQGIADTY